MRETGAPSKPLGEAGKECVATDGRTRAHSARGRPEPPPREGPLTGQAACRAGTGQGVGGGVGWGEGSL